jgi:hypothetical protein
VCSSKEKGSGLEKVHVKSSIGSTTVSERATESEFGGWEVELVNGQCE